MQQGFEWRPLSLSDWDQLRSSRIQFHRAIQNVSAVGRRFSPTSRNDEHATLQWVPGLSRLVSKWVKGTITFRSSICFDTFSIFLVDEKVTTLAEFELQGKTHRQLMIWLEEQIGKLGLAASNLAMKLPYELPNYESNSKVPFQINDMLFASELGRYYHDAYIVLRRLKEELKLGEIVTWPHHFDLALDYVIKDSGDPETTTKIGMGLSPGDETIEIPYFYVNTWPHVDVNKCEKLHKGRWVSDEWTGAILMASELIESDNQEAEVEAFYRESSEQLLQLLIN